MANRLVEAIRESFSYQNAVTSVVWALVVAGASLVISAVGGGLLELPVWNQVASGFGFLLIGMAVFVGKTATGQQVAQKLAASAEEQPVPEPVEPGKDEREFFPYFGTQTHGSLEGKFALALYPAKDKAVPRAVTCNVRAPAGSKWASSHEIEPFKGLHAKWQEERWVFACAYPDAFENAVSSPLPEGTWEVSWRDATTGAELAKHTFPFPNPVSESANSVKPAR